MKAAWKLELHAAITDPRQAWTRLQRQLPPPEGLPLVEASLPVRIPAAWLELIDPDDPDDPLLRQCLPSVDELIRTPLDVPDAVGDRAHSPVPGVVYKQQSRAILLVSSACALYCRFCFRRPLQAGPAADARRAGLEQAFGWLADHPEVKEVILSGGDPLLLEDAALDAILARLDQLPHLRLKRIHTRVPSALPSRLTPELAACLRAHRPLTLVSHFNHPRELSPRVRAGLACLSDAGIPLLNQSVLLRGVNDRLETLEALSWGLLEAGVIPYYLHHCDRPAGTGGFRLPLSEGLALMAALRQRVPGHALPRYVLDLPDGTGKVPLEPSALRPTLEGHWEVLRPDGSLFRYEEVPASSR